MSQGYAPQQQQYVMQQQTSYGYPQQQGGLQYGSAQVQSQAPMQQYAQAVPHPPVSPLWLFSPAREVRTDQS